MNRPKRGPYWKTRQLQPPNPSGICECGCGCVTPLAKITNVARGVIAGHHLRRLPAHANTGRKRGPYAPVKHLAPPNPSGICQCGARGLKTPIARQSCSERGWIIGKHVPFIHNHHGKAAVQYVVEDRGCPLGPCWIWQLGTDKNGYGVMSDSGHSRRAHRVYYARAKGSIPSGFDVDHLCFIRSCVNPEHLEAVPPIINQRRKQRNKLTQEMANQIRLSGESASHIACRLNVCATTIRRVRNNMSWVETANPTHAQVIDC